MHIFKFLLILASLTSLCTRINCINNVTCDYLYDNSVITQVDNINYISLEFIHFSRISDIQFFCFDDDNFTMSTNKSYDIVLNDQNYMIFDQAIDFNYFSINILSLRLFNFKGFNLNTYLYTFNYIIEQDIHLSIYNSKFDFYIDNKLSNEMCNTTEWSLLKWKFKQKSIIIYPSVIFMKDKYCPLIFSNSKVNYLCFYRFFNTKLLISRLIFKKVPTRNLTINSKIVSLSIDTYLIDLDSQFYSKSVFEKTQILYVNGVIKTIDKFLFKDFNMIRHLCLNLYKVRDFLSKGLDWLSSINSQIQLNDDKNSLDLFLTNNSDQVVFWG